MRDVLGHYLDEWDLIGYFCIGGTERDIFGLFVVGWEVPGIILGGCG